MDTIIQNISKGETWTYSIHILSHIHFDLTRWHRMQIASAGNTFMSQKSEHMHVFWHQNHNILALVVVKITTHYQSLTHSPLHYAAIHYN